MAERPILFSGEMVRAILAGRKTQTRRVVKSQPPEGVGRIFVDRFAPLVVDRYGLESPGPEHFGAYDDSGEWGQRSPYGQPGDTLWVRETWTPLDSDSCIPIHIRTPFLVPSETEVAYRADHLDPSGDAGPLEWRPSIHMPRWASRITLRVTDVRVERVQDITPQDIEAEGVSLSAPQAPGFPDYELNWRTLWDAINGKREGCAWADNPWVWAVSFEVTNG